MNALWRDAALRGDMEAAWAVSDQVLAGRNPADRDNPALPYHQRWVWDGRAFAGRHVLVRCYHGLGDTLQFARFLPALRSRVASLTLELQPELLPLLSSLPGADRLIAFNPAAPAPPSECDLEIMELCHALRLRPDAVAPPYLQVTPSPLPPGSMGVCWQSGGWDPSRSMPAELAAMLLGDRLAYSLQQGSAPPGLRVANPDGCPTAIAATAALIAGLSLVLTVDTMVAHLAGALGRPTWLMLPYAADWRWGQKDRVAWYPSMHVYRQSHCGAWRTLAARIVADLGSTTFGLRSYRGGRAV